MAIKSGCTIYKCDKCGKQIVAEPEIASMLKFYEVTDAMSIPAEPKDKDFHPGEMNTITVFIPTVEMANVQERGDIMPPSANIGHKVDTHDFHVCKDCMSNDIMEAYSQLLEVNEKVRDLFYK